MAYAEDVNYWQSSRTSPDTWLDKAKQEIERVGGQVAAEGFVSEALTGRSSFMLAFSIEADNFKLLWPVLESKTGKVKAARIQAATALYHEVKAACVKAKFLGARSAFFAYLMLPNGKTASESSASELIAALPELLGGTGQLLLEG